MGNQTEACPRNKRTSMRMSENLDVGTRPLPAADLRQYCSISRRRYEGELIFHRMVELFNACYNDEEKTSS